MTAAEGPRPSAGGAEPPEDAAALARHADALAEAIREALPRWVDRCVADGLARAGRQQDEAVEAAAREAGERCALEVGAAVAVLLATDVDEQANTPLALLRSAVRYPTEVLAAAGVPPVDRDDFARSAFPDDPYDLTPASFGDVDPSLVELGIAWGAAKAHVHRRRHRGTGS